MGFIRGLLAVFICILLFIVFLAGNIFLTLTLSLKYHAVHDQIKPLIEDTLTQELDINITEEINKELASMEINCEEYSEGYTFTEGQYTITLSCETITQGADVIIDSGIDSLIKEAYYKEYDCEFWNCFDESEMPLFLVSKKAHDYWKAKFYWALTTALVLIGLLFLLFKRKHNTFIIPGILLMATSLPFLKIEALVSISGDRILFEFLRIFFSKAKSVFRISFFTGIGFVILGFIFRLFIIGFKLTQFFHREEPPPVKGAKPIQKPKKK